MGSEAEAVPAPVAEEVAAKTAAPLKPCCACPKLNSQEIYVLSRKERPTAQSLSKPILPVWGKPDLKFRPIKNNKFPSASLKMTLATHNIFPDYHTAIFIFLVLYAAFLCT